MLFEGVSATYLLHPHGHAVKKEIYARPPPFVLKTCSSRSMARLSLAARTGVEKGIVSSRRPIFAVKSLSSLQTPKHDDRIEKASTLQFY